MDKLKLERLDALCNELGYLIGKGKQEVLDFVSKIDAYTELVALVSEMRKMQHKREHEADIAMMNGMSRCDLGLLNCKVEELERQVDVKLIELLLLEKPL